jgi:hypothetical protein
MRRSIPYRCTRQSVPTHGAHWPTADDHSAGSRAANDMQSSEVAPDKPAIGRTRTLTMEDVWVQQQCSGTNWKARSPSSSSPSGASQPAPSTPTPRRFKPPELLDIVGFTAKPSAPELVERARLERRCLLRQKINFSQRRLNHLHYQLARRSAIRRCARRVRRQRAPGEVRAGSRSLASRSASPGIASPMTYIPDVLAVGIRTPAIASATQTEWQGRPSE